MRLLQPRANTCGFFFVAIRFLSVLRSAPAFRSSGSWQRKPLQSTTRRTMTSNVSNNVSNNNCLTLISLPREWQDFDAKKDSVHRIDDDTDSGTLEGLLLLTLLQNSATTQNDDNANNNNNNDNDDKPFDTIVTIDEDDDEDRQQLIVALDLVTATSTNHNEEPPNTTTTTRSSSIQLHLNRDANEMASKAFRRLEISVSKKLLSKTKKKKRKAGGGTNTNNFVESSSSSSSWRLIEESSSSSNNNNNTSEVDTTAISTLGLCRKLAGSSTGSVVLEMSLPNENHDDDERAAEAGAARFRCTVRSNPPVILSTETFESFRSKLFVGIPVVLKTTLLHATRTEVSWFLVDNNNNNNKAELVLTDSHSFVPESRHAGKFLKVVLRPWRRKKESSSSSSSSSSSDHKIFGTPEAYAFENPIEELPPMPIVSPLRDSFTKKKKKENGQRLRVCTYNILADLYVSRKGTGSDNNNDNKNENDETAYPHVDYKHVDKIRRMPMIAGELLAYNADILCLQEVDGSVYDGFLQPVFWAMGYDGYYSNKASSQREGCAIFWSRELFRVDEAASFHVRDLFRMNDNNNSNSNSNNNWESMDGIHRLLESHADLKTVVTEKLGQVLQIATLELNHPNENQPKKIVIANTHLFWHPMADHIRAMQVFVVSKQLDEVRRNEESIPRPFFLCGDLNSDPLSGASQLLSSRSLAPDQHDCWKYLHDYKWDVDESEVLEIVDGGNTAEERRAETRNEKRTRHKVATVPTQSTIPHMALPPSFAIVRSGCTETPPFTNYALNFVDTLDYVLASKASETEPFGFEPKESAPMPSIEDVEQHISMPNEFMPSDHVSIVCDFEWCRHNEN